MQVTCRKKVLYLSQEDPLEKEVTASILALRIHGQKNLQVAVQLLTNE